MGCACGKDTCGCQAPTLIYLQDESGERHAFYIADKIHANGNQYAFAVSTEDSTQSTLLRVWMDESGEERLSNIVDEHEWEAIERSLAMAQ